MALVFKYDVFLDNMNEEAFKYCRKALYPCMGFLVMKEEDVRKLDVQEWLTRLEKDIFLEIQKKTNGSPVEYYVNLLKKYMTYFTQCKQGSRAARYYNRAFESLDKYLKHCGDGGINDAMEIFISLLRQRKEKPEDVGKTIFLDATFENRISDIDALKLVFDNRFDLPDGIYEKEGIFAKEDEEVKEKIKRFFFSVSVLYLSENLQNVGIFSGEDEK